MGDTYQLDPELAAFHDASRQILEKFKDGTLDPPKLSESFRPGGPSGRGLPGAIQSQLAGYDDILDGLTREIEKLASRLAAGNADGEDVFAAMGRVEAYLDILKADSLKVRSWRVGRGDEVARDSLASVYEHTLGEILEWLKTVVDALTDPIAMLNQQGHSIPGMSETPHRVRAGNDGGSGSEGIDLQLVLTLTEAPKLSMLARWAERQTRQKRRYKSDGMWWSFLVGGVLGWWLGDMADDE